MRAANSVHYVIFLKSKRSSTLTGRNVRLSNLLIVVVKICEQSNDVVSFSGHPVDDWAHTERHVQGK